MIVRILFILFTITLTTTISAEDNIYVGKINYAHSSLMYQIGISVENNKTKVHYSCLDMNAYQIPALKISLTLDSLIFYILSDAYIYEYKFKRISNDFKGRLYIYANETEQLLNSFETTIIKIKNPVSNVKKRDVSFLSNGLQLHGTLWEPTTPGKRALVFVTSSQGSDRSATSAEAYYFSSLGFLVFHYDKRGTGKSDGNWESATIEELASDDINAILFLSSSTHIPISQIGIKGSSQGGIKIPYILSKLPTLKYGVSVSCPGGSLLESDLNHWRNNMINTVGMKNIDLATSVQKVCYEYLAGLNSFDAVETILHKYSKQPWFKHIWVPEKQISKDKKLTFSGLSYFKKIKQPILIIQGLSDIVIPKKSYQVIDKALKEAGNEVFKIHILKNTTHSMTILDNKFPYFQRIAPNYLTEITKWVHALDTTQISTTK